MTPGSVVVRFLLALTVALALSCVPAAARGLKDYQRTVWTQEEGAPPDITALAQATDGWLWVGSGDGLFRFDGVAFEPYAPPGYPELAHTRVVELHAADNGDLYVSYFPKDVAVIRRDGRVEMLPQPEGFRRQLPLAMVLDGDNTLWTIGDGIRKFAQGRWTTVESDPVWGGGGLYSMLLDQDGRLWASAPAGVWRLDRGTGRFVKIVDGGGGLATAPNGDVWVLGLGGGQARRLAVSVAGKPRSPRAAAVSSRSAGQFSADGTLWALGCPDTACLVHDAALNARELVPARQADERLRSADHVVGQEPVGILEDREGNLWIVAHNGLNRFRPKRFLMPGLDLTDFFYSVASDGAGMLWIAETESGKLWRLGPDGVPVIQPGRAVHLLASARDGSVLMADKRRITRVRGGRDVETISLPPGPDGKPLDRQLFGLLDDGKRVWTAAADLGAIAWSDGKWQVSASVGLPNKIYLSQAGEPGQLWLALSTGELVLHDGARLTRYDATPVGIATGIFPGQHLLLGGSNGLAVLKQGKLQLMRSADPDVLRGVSGIAVTPDGDRWLNGVAGVVHVRAADWQRAVDRPDQLLRYELFGAVDGYPGRASIQWRRPTAISGAGGRVWFIATNGIVGLDTADLRRNPVAPRPMVQDVSTDSARFDSASDLVLPPGSESFRVRFTAPSLRQPEKTRFEYRLIGIDAHWRAAENRRTTSYTNVGPGSYVFQVRASNEDGVVSKEPALMRLTVAPTLVQSWPFQLAVVAALVVLLVTLYRLRVRYLTGRLIERLQIQLAERERIARTLHDSFLQTVQVLLLRLRKLERELDQDSGARQELRTIVRDAQSVINEGREQVHELRVSNGRTMEEIVHDCAGGLRVLYPEVEFVQVSEGCAVSLPPALVEEAGAIACEALRNAYHHAHARRIVLNIGYRGSDLTVTVEDDGRGLDAGVAAAGHRSGHWGLVGMRERAARIGAELAIQSAAGHGTVVTLRMALTGDPIAHGTDAATVSVPGQRECTR